MLVTVVRSCSGTRFSTTVEDLKEDMAALDQLLRSKS